jgi:hypothetical protein
MADLSEECTIFEHFLRTNMKSLHTWKYPLGGSETNVNDPNLSKYLGYINRLIGTSDLTLITSVLSNTMPFQLVIAKQSSKPEYRIGWGDYVLIGSEAKGVEHSQYGGLVQGFEVAGDSAVHMWRCGLSAEHAVVPVIFTYSDCFRISAMYLIPECYPVLVHLSPAMTFLTLAGRCQMARWGIVLAQFAVSTISLLQDIDSRWKQTRALGLYISPHLFFKPIREFHKSTIDVRESVLVTGSGMRCNVELMMQAYHRIHLNEEDAHAFFLFPPWCDFVTPPLVLALLGTPFGR